MATNLPITIDQGSTFPLELTLTNDETGLPIDFTGYTGRGQVRLTFDSLTAYDFTVSFNADPTDGIVLIEMDADTTASLPVVRRSSYQKRPTYMCYDIELIRPDGSVWRILEGIVTVVPEVTHD